MGTSYKAVSSQSTFRSPRTRLTKEQTMYLKEIFSQEWYPDSSWKRIISRSLNLDYSFVQTWFQNMRASERKKYKKYYNQRGVTPGYFEQLNGFKETYKDFGRFGVHEPKEHLCHTSRYDAGIMKSNYSMMAPFASSITGNYLYASNWKNHQSLSSASRYKDGPINYKKYKLYDLSETVKHMYNIE